MPRTSAATAFAKPTLFGAWLAKNHARAAELIVRCYKNHAAERGMTYHQALDEALCFGWIDGVRRPIDEDTFSVRFSPRRPKSKWSAVNVARVKVLLAEGRMRPPGREAYRKRGEGGSRAGYSYESRPEKLSPAFLTRLRSKPRALSFYESRPPWYQRITAFWVMSAKRDETRERRFATLLALLEEGRILPGLERRGEKGRSKN